MIKLIATDDKEKITKFMLLDEVWRTFENDTCKKCDYSPFFGNDCLWFNVVLHEENIGLVLVKQENCSTLSLHPYLLKKHRRQIRILLSKFFVMFLKTPDFINKLTVEIPFNRKIVYNVAKKAGFIDEGINRNSVLKNGVFIDQWQLGLTKNEIFKLTGAIQ